MKLSDLKPNPNNPRLIKDDKFKKLVQSIKDFPEMMEKRPIVVVTDIDGKMYQCLQCKSDFKSKKGCKSRTPKYCSKKCYAESLKMNKKCILCNKIIENKHSASLKHRKYCSKKCQSESRKCVPLSEEWKKALSEGRKKSEKCKGENLYNWKGGKKTEKERMKTSFYKRKKALKKDLPIYFLQRVLKLQKNKCFFCEKSL